MFYFVCIGDPGPPESKAAGPRGPEGAAAPDSDEGRPSGGSGGLCLPHPRLQEACTLLLQAHRVQPGENEHLQGRGSLQER